MLLQRSLRRHDPDQVQRVSLIRLRIFALHESRIVAGEPLREWQEPTPFIRLGPSDRTSSRVLPWGRILERTLIQTRQM